MRRLLPASSRSETRRKLLFPRNFLCRGASHGAGPGSICQPHAIPERGKIALLERRLGGGAEIREAAGSAGLRLCTHAIEGEDALIRLRDCILTAAAAASALPAAARAHHSVAAWFDRGATAEIEGVVTDIRWENPHVRFFMRAPNAEGREVEWEIETLSVSGISRWGITADLLSVGDHVRVSGSPSRRGLDNIFVRNLLLPSGQELVFGGDPIYSDNALRGGESLSSSEGDGSRPELGVFRVWSSGRGAGQVFPESFDNDFDFSYYPLTESAKAAVERFNYIEQDPTNDCRPKGMPIIMEQPYPVEFIDEGDSIRMLIEEYDTVRIIHMRNVPEPASQPASPLGFSTGRFDGRDLVVTTTRIDSGTFDSVGIPLSLEARIEERFAPSEDGSTLNYTIEVEDPVNFTAAVRSGKRFIYVAGIAVQAFNCTN